MHTFLQIAEIVVGIAIIVVVLKQPAKADGFNLISSGNETFYSKNKTKTYESVLAKTTVILAILFALITIGLTLTAK
ncbi:MULTISPECIES: preprotein translocase subunit SecG [Clostridium]|uniref:Protein-export membrane protein SecG n=1 Tax=Clostridium novyi (strain NT) TaxID=386415 RepID=A0PYP5_CLONN|nr:MULTISPECIES: preprotein translocase subunit SecG [Clostridium]ABK61512.1 preprotein translocase, SecG subunit [Clostridium novyi NT]KEH86810.1 preprotein translocase subunit SecG [Clostridium novyi A str. NCTC 538]KEH89321.1 preprotein translocase subunit SecG [Clostridium novyi A str. 4540]KEH90218.1 preprotein translocase subunit SecG [Clostridium novyi A str. BKT29909]KEH94922.1 preprotein translocase subunit SecG [Clostridium botulinum C/D str. It1]